MAFAQNCKAIATLEAIQDPEMSYDNKYLKNKQHLYVFFVECVTTIRWFGNRGGHFLCLPG